MTLTAFSINCTLTPSPAESSCERLIAETLTELERHGVTGEQIRAVDFNIKLADS
ncbi:hypothetical protein [Vreelandella indica]|jgi:hypothetical protein|uniref:hypothetical protein n=1 Tax=Vreelandella indica TaxID=3126500 RepID=UPI00300DE675